MNNLFSCGAGLNVAGGGSLTVAVRIGAPAEREIGGRRGDGRYLKRMRMRFSLPP